MKRAGAGAIWPFVQTRTPAESVLWWQCKKHPHNPEARLGSTKNAAEPKTGMCAHANQYTSKNAIQEQVSNHLISAKPILDASGDPMLSDLTLCQLHRGNSAEPSLCGVTRDMRNPVWYGEATFLHRRQSKCQSGARPNRCQSSGDPSAPTHLLRCRQHKCQHGSGPVSCYWTTSVYSQSQLGSESLIMFVQVVQFLWIENHAPERKVQRVSATLATAMTCLGNASPSGATRAQEGAKRAVS